MEQHSKKNQGILYVLIDWKIINDQIYHVGSNFYKKYSERRYLFDIFCDMLKYSGQVLNFLHCIDQKKELVNMKLEKLNLSINASTGQ